VATDNTDQAGTAVLEELPTPSRGVVVPQPAGAVSCADVPRSRRSDPVAVVPVWPGSPAWSVTLHGAEWPIAASPGLRSASAGHAALRPPAFRAAGTSLPTNTLAPFDRHA